jgi:hypothetical protein
MLESELHGVALGRETRSALRFGRALQHAAWVVRVAEIGPLALAAANERGGAQPAAVQTRGRNFDARPASLAVTEGKGNEKKKRPTVAVARALALVAVPPPPRLHPLPSPLYLHRRDALHNGWPKDW